MHRRPLTVLVAATTLAVGLSSCTANGPAPVSKAAPAVQGPQVVETTPTAEPTAEASPSTGVSLKPWPEKPQASRTRSCSGCRPTTACSSGVSV